MKVASNIVKQVLLTEKGTRLSELENKYLFKVAINSNNCLLYTSDAADDP